MNVVCGRHLSGAIMKKVASGRSGLARVVQAQHEHPELFAVLLEVAQEGME